VWVDPTEARNDIVSCFGRSDRSKQGDRLGCLVGLEINKVGDSGAATIPEACCEATGRCIGMSNSLQHSLPAPLERLSSAWRTRGTHPKRILEERFANGGGVEVVWSKLGDDFR
jgi:hypothetical protein